ncbi:hypothetical protein QW180_00480 [Vibrio sinaloensis]|nr:hypothetical protein [Vibrio sinaloensis]
MKIADVIRSQCKKGDIFLAVWAERNS